MVKMKLSKRSFASMDAKDCDDDDSTTNASHLSKSFRSSDDLLLENIIKVLSETSETWFDDYNLNTDEESIIAV